MLKKQLTQMNLPNNRRIRWKDVWSATGTNTKLNTACDTFKYVLKIIEIKLIFNFQFLTILTFSSYISCI
jgi:hypothetical protein